MRELRRGGQVYFLHNEVDTIERMRERLAKPAARRRASRWRTARCASATSSA